MKNTIFRKTASILLCFGLLFTLSGCAKDETAGNRRTMNLAVQPSIAFLPTYIARANGWIEEAVKDMDVTVTWTDFEAGPPMNESFAANQQDIGLLGDVPAVSAVSAGQDIVWISAESGGEHYAILVLNDSDINTPADLKGKKIGVTIGSQGQNLMEKVLSSANVSVSDIEMINISQGDAQAVLVNKEVDAVSVWEPNITRLVQTGQMRIIADGEDVGCNGENVIVARQEFVQQNPDLVKIYLEQYYRGVKALEEDPSGCCELVAEYFGIEPELIESTLYKYTYGMKFEQDDIDAMRDTASFLARIGVIDKDISVEEYIDDSIAREVLSENNQ